jgi:lipoprotein-releasing system ATP-binding protein
VPLVVSQLFKSFQDRSSEVKVLQGCDFVLQDGESISISGPSGTGKSTLLNILGTLEPATSGSVVLNGTDVLSLGEREVPKFRRENIGFVFQDHHLLPQCTALENVLMPYLAMGRIADEHLERGTALLHQVDLAKQMHRRPSELSGGERQRVAIARALLFQPTLLLADEPTGNLDRKNADNISKLLLRLSASSIRIIVTHDPVLANQTTRQAVLDNGMLRD